MRNPVIATVPDVSMFLWSVPASSTVPVEMPNP